MLKSSKIHERLIINVHSVIECEKFLILHKVSYVLTAMVCQDTLANYFGLQRSSDARKNNDSLNNFCYNSIVINKTNFCYKLKVLKRLATGNVSDENVNFQIDTTLVPCHKTHKLVNP